MLPRLAITSECAPCAATLARLADILALPQAEPQSADWHLHAGRSTINLTHADTALFSLPAPQPLARLAQALETALQHWQQRPVPMGQGWEFSPLRRACLHAAHPPVELTDKEAALLAALLDATGTPIDRDTLLSAVWAYENGVDSHTLETHIYRLRGKTGQLTGLPLEIRAENEGYRLILP